VPATSVPDRGPTVEVDVAQGGFVALTQGDVVRSRTGVGEKTSNTLGFALT
jgi:hypothetical protein